MRTRLVASPLESLGTDVAACFAHEGDEAPCGVVAATLRRELARRMKAERFRGQPGDRVLWSGPAGRFVVLGLGPRRSDGGTGEALRIGCARAAREADACSAASLGILVPPAAEGNGPRELRAAVEGALLGAYRFDRHLTEPSRRPHRLRALTLAVDELNGASRTALRRATAGAEAVALARDLVNEGPSRMNPPALAKQAATTARAAGLACKVRGPAELRRLGLGAMLSVARGSAEPAQLVHLTYRPKAARRAARRILLVGKGVTFDSGGLDIKPADSMLTMKCDMAGAAAVLAAMSGLASVGCRAEVHALLGLVENMTGGTAYKPGDILDTWSGKTVEVGNTDAEGRLVLCDLLAYGAATVRPAAIVDVATLTGACVVALGLRMSGLFARGDRLRDELLSAAKDAGEKLWPMPLHEEYLAGLQKGPADLCNVAGRWGGAITAALFLGEFVPRTIPWAHLDIAGPAFTDVELPEAAPGGTGAAVLTLLRWLESA